jgi:carbon monoxide dehydrogenase subunit G
MAGFKRSIVVARPIGEVFSFATNPDNASLFLPGVTKIEMLTDGGMRPGARFRETRRFKGKERSAVIKVVAHDPPVLHAASASMLGMKATYTFHFARVEAGTKVDMVAEVTGNLLWKLFLGMMSRAMEEADGEYLTRLKKVMEK